ncbi:MAG: transketolase C-terminal domain-containing protein [Oscillospiraceae bacterium]|nr:transketolase C-terminal domain-containing protein [Oscillospiraceae bacterium]
MTTKSTREAAMLAITEAARKDEKIVIISPDSVAAARATKFRDEFPDRVIEVGIAEQDAVDIAAGLATTGMKPVVVTYAGFLTMRACEMIRTFIAYPGLNVKLIGLNGGMLGGEREGVTHQFYEDVGILRSMPGVKILCPADAQQAYCAAKAMMDIDGPAYLRLGSGREPEVFPEGTPFEFGKIREVKSYGDDVAVFASGFIMNRAIEAVDRLHAEGVNATLIDVSTVKPLDSAGVAAVLRRTNCAVAVEDHNIYGGMSSAICEVACHFHPCKVRRLGLKDVYPRSGKAAELLDAYGLSVQDIMDAARDAMIKE